MRLSLSDTIKYGDKALVQKETNAAQNVSFKRLPQKIMISVSKALDKSSVLTGYSGKIETEPTMRFIRNQIGTSADTLYKHIKRDKIIGANIISDDKTTQFRNKKPIRLILDGLLYPITKIPFYVLYGFTNFLKKFNAVKNSAWMKKFEKSSFYHVTHSYLKKDDKLNALQGLMELGNKKNVMGAKNRAKSFLHNTAKTFDSKCGNYNSVNERALTRIVTGFIPAFFLANDAHNLSILCNNNKKEASEEKKVRFRQEAGRVLSNAYIQLITLGALSKFINKSKSWFVGVTVGTVLLTEMYSRLRVGRKIHFISPEEAREINLKEQKKSGLTFVLDKTTNSMKVGINGVQNFTSNPEYNKFKDYDKKIKEEIAQRKKNQHQRSIIGLNTFLKIVGGIIATGFAIKGLKKIPLGKNRVGDIFAKTGNWFKKIYSAITTKQNHFDKNEIEKVFEKMEKNGFSTISKAYKKVVIDHHRHLLYPKFMKGDFYQKVKGLGNKNWQQALQEFVFGTDSSKLISLLKKEKISHNFNVFKRYLETNKETELLKTVNELTKKSTPEKAYQKLHKLFAKSENEKYREIFENIYATDAHSLKNDFLNNLKRRMKKANLEELWNSTEKDVLSEIDDMKYYDLGKSKIPVLKDAIDFCIEPFKFVWNFATAPYRYLVKIPNITKVKPRSATEDITVVSNALATLRKKTGMTDTAFKHMFDEKIVKGFNTTTMSKIANSDLSALAKSASTLATMSFLIADNYNMVMLKSNGMDTEEASAKGKERCVQEVSRFFWQQLFINLFNNTFSNTYNASLLGASAVNTASTLIGEVCTRKAVGLPITAASKDDIIDLEKRNLSGNGIKSKFYRFMSKLTGKQILSERHPHKNQKTK